MNAGHSVNPAPLIQHRARAMQIIDFSGLRFQRGITPSDIDCLGVSAALDFGKEGIFIIIECKYNGKLLDRGQLVALESLVDTLNKGGKQALLIIADHHVHAPENDIDLARCIVRDVRLPNASTRRATSLLTVRQCIESFCKPTSDIFTSKPLYGF